MGIQKELLLITMVETGPNSDPGTQGVPDPSSESMGCHITQEVANSE